jgi:regulator of protease activity HflC (stomatin/prohibitin superfamily)
MTLIVLGIILLASTLILAKSNANFEKFAGVAKIISLLFIVLGIATACVKQIDTGEVGVKVLFGNVQNDVLPSGLHFVNPLLDIKKLDIKTQNYTMSGTYQRWIGNNHRFNGAVPASRYRCSPAASGNR